MDVTEVPVEAIDLATATPQEVLLHVELAHTRKELQQLGASITPAETEQERLAREAATHGDTVDPAALGPASAQGPTSLIDPGGPTGPEAEQHLAKVDRMYDEAEKLKQGGNRAQGAQLKLRALHADPRKVVVSSGPADTGDVSDVDL